MDGVEMDMVLDVVGDKGTGILHVNCTIDGDSVFDWQPATWTMDGHSTEISSVPNLYVGEIWYRVSTHRTRHCSAANPRRRTSFRVTSYRFATVALMSAFLESDQIAAPH
jgi:hypothetical protein